MKTRDQSSGAAGSSRRTLLKTGAAGGVLLWTAPAVQVIGMGVANADDPSAPPPLPPPPVNLTGKVPSHAIFLVDCDGLRYGIKIDGGTQAPGATLTFGKIASPEDKGFMADPDGDGTANFSWADPPSTLLAKFSALFASGDIFAGPDASGELAIVACTLPAGCAWVAGAAYVFDGGLQKCGDGDKFQAAISSAGCIYFYGACKEVA